jgi:phage major head subunit gpT-like protein
MEKITSRAVIGMYYQALETVTGAAWIGKVSNLFKSDQASEEYAWLSFAPKLREWIGGRHAKGFIENGITIENKHYEATLEIAIKDLRRDKTGQLQVRINEMVERARTHWATLLTTLITNGASQLCYDGQYFFDTDHVEGDSGSQSNKLTVDLSDLPAQVHGTTTAPSPEEAQQAVLKAISQMFSFVDDQGEPLNETATSFLVMAPVGLSESLRAGLSLSRVAGPSSMAVEDWNIELAVNPRLTAAGWTDKFVVIRTDGSILPFIRQEETAENVKLKDEDSEFAFDNDAIQVGVDTWRNVGYGRWQGAVQVTLTA